MISNYYHCIYLVYSPISLQKLNILTKKKKKMNELFEKNHENVKQPLWWELDTSFYN